MRSVVIGVLLCICILLVAAGTASRTHAASPRYVTRIGDRLVLNDHNFRFSGANVYWGGLDENGRTGLNYPTQFRVKSALATVADMGETVVRCQSCGVSTGNPYSVEPSLGVFNEQALRHIDYFVAQAQHYGVRLVVPLTDNYAYYLGGYHSFTDWLGLSSSKNCPSAACASIFYTNLKAIAAFKRYISVMLNHVNVYTGVANKDNPTIMSWEIGNEMPYGTGGQPEFTAWTGTISSFIKSMAPNQLVMDGAESLDPGDLLLSDVDIQSPHLYPINIPYLRYVSLHVRVARQALVVGEYAWNSPGLNSFLHYVEQTPSISGDIYWDLMPQNDDFGYVEHYDGYQLHFPGDRADVGGTSPPELARFSDATSVTALRVHAYEMSGKPPPRYAVPVAPKITNVERVTSSTAGSGNVVEWRGSPGAATYIVRRSTRGPSGPWTTVCESCTDTDEGPFVDKTAVVGPMTWYRVIARNPAGVLGPSSAAFAVPRQTLDDNLDNFSRSWSHSAGIALMTGHGSLFQGDPSRAGLAASSRFASITWKVPGVRAIEAVAYGKNGAPDLQIMVSLDGRDWVRVPDAYVQSLDGAVTVRSDWQPCILTIENLPQAERDAKYVQVRWSDDSQLGEMRMVVGR